MDPVIFCPWMNMKVYLSLIKQYFTLDWDGSQDGLNLKGMNYLRRSAFVDNQLILIWVIFRYILLWISVTNAKSGTIWIVLEFNQENTSLRTIYVNCVPEYIY